MAAALTLSFVGGTTAGRVPSAVRSGREGWGPLWKSSLVESAPTRSPRRGHHVELKWWPSGQRHEGPQSSARGGAPAAGGWGRRPEAQALWPAARRPLGLLPLCCSPAGTGPGPTTQPAELLCASNRAPSGPPAHVCATRGWYWGNAKNSPDRDSKAPIDSARAATAASRAPAPTRPGGASKKGKGNGEGLFFFFSSLVFISKNMNCRLGSQPGESAAPAGSRAAMPPAPVITVLAPSRF